jgi:hypothetical protein
LEQQVEQVKERLDQLHLLKDQQHLQRLQHTLDHLKAAKSIAASALRHRPNQSKQELESWERRQQVKKEQWRWNNVHMQQHKKRQRDKKHNDDAWKTIQKHELPKQQHALPEQQLLNDSKVPPMLRLQLAPLLGDLKLAQAANETSTTVALQQEIAQVFACNHETAPPPNTTLPQVLGVFQGTEEFKDKDALLIPTEWPTAYPTPYPSPHPTSFPTPVPAPCSPGSLQAGSTGGIDCQVTVTVKGMYESEIGGFLKVFISNRQNISSFQVGSQAVVAGQTNTSALVTVHTRRRNETACLFGPKRHSRRGGAQTRVQCASTGGRDRARAQRREVAASGTAPASSPHPPGGGKQDDRTHPRRVLAKSGAYHC